MSDELITNPALLAPVPVTSTPPVAPAPNRDAGSTSVDTESFSSLLAKAGSTGSPSFSKHALERLARRGVELDQSSLTRLSDGISRAAGKGSRNSVVFVDGTAYVTSIQNNTVITAVTPEAMRSHVFTNIDSAVIA